VPVDGYGHRKEMRLDRYEHGEDAGRDPLVGEADVIGLYRPDLAALASRVTFCGKPWPGWVDD